MTTLPYLTKYERAALLAERAKSLVNGDKPRVSTDTTATPVDIAKLELESHVIPLEIIRDLPNGTKEIFNVNKMTVKKLRI